MLTLRLLVAERWGKYLELEEQTYHKAVQLATDARGAQDFFSAAMHSLSAAFGAVAQQYGVFNEDLGFANRGTFLIDTSGVVRFAEMMGPGEARDQGAWEKALATLDS